MTITIHPTAIIDADARLYESTRGTNIKIGAYSVIFSFAVIRPVGGDGDVVIGEHCYINSHCVLYSGNGIHLGNHVLLAPGVCIVPANHAFRDRERPVREQGFMPSKGGVFIEDDVWVGANSTILDGAQIGKGAIIAAGSVVAGEIPPFEIWGGSPFRKLQDR